MDTKIKASFWSDAVIESLDARGKLAILWLLTANVSHCGWASATKKRFEFETGLKWTALEKATQAFGGALVKGKDGWWIRNYIRHQIADGDQLARNNMRFPILNSMSFVSAEIVAEILKEYPQLSSKKDTPPPPLTDPSPTTPPPQEQSRAEQSRAEVLNGKEVQEETNAEQLPTGFPVTVAQAIEMARQTGCAAPDEYLSEVWKQAHGRGGRDGAGTTIRRWGTHVDGRWDREQFDWKAKRNGNGSRTQTPRRRDSGDLNSDDRYT